MLQIALQLAGFGLRVLPLFPILGGGSCGCNQRECAGAGKHPKLNNWQHRATTDKEQVRDWWTVSPESGIGIATGSGSGVWVLDIDTRHNGMESLRELEGVHGELPNVPSVITGGGGLHYYFKYPSTVEIKNRVGIAPGIDVRGEGGYVVSPGSAHASGKRYEWELKEDESTGPTDAPLWLLDLVLGSSAGSRTKVSAGRDIIENRNDSLMRLGCALRNTGFDEPGILAALIAENDARCQPPLPVYEVEKIAASCALYERGNPERAAAEIEAFNMISDWSKERPPLARASEVVIGRELLDELAETDGEIPVFCEGDLYSYRGDRGIWAARSDDELCHIVQKYEGRGYIAGHTKTGEEIIKPLALSRGRVKGAVQCAQSDVIGVDFFEDVHPGICVSNGFLKIGKEGAHISHHSADHRARHCVPYEYDPKLKADRWMQFLMEVFSGPEMEQKAMLLQEFAGAALVPGLATKYQRCLVLHGAGANGKSVAMDVISSLIPIELRSSVPPQRFAQDYAAAMLKGVMLNAAGEIPDGDIAGSDRFKSVIAGEPIQARQPYKPAFTFRPVAANLFSCNQLPGSTDMSHGYWRRFIILKFEHRFDGKKRDEGLTDRLIRTELTGVVRWAIDGAVRLMKQGGYTMPKSSKEALDTWRQESDQIAQWVDEQSKPIRLKAVDSDSTGTAARTLYSNYADWASDSGHRQVSLTKFCQRLKVLGFIPRRTSSARLYPLKLRSLGEQPFDWTQERASR